MQWCQLERKMGVLGFALMQISAQSWDRFGDTGILPAGDQIWDALERDPWWPSHLASHWSTGVQWLWWHPWWLDSCDGTLGRYSGIKGKGLLLPEVDSCWICSCELQSMLLRRYWTWRAVCFATHLLVAAPTETVAWAHPNYRSSRTSDWSALQGAAWLAARSTCWLLMQLYILPYPHADTDYWLLLHSPISPVPLSTTHPSV